MIRRAGACLGLLAFCLTIVRGMGAGNPPEVILTRALWAMIIFFLLGLVLGLAGHLAINEHTANRAKALAVELERARTGPDDAEAAETAEAAEAPAAEQANA